MRLQLSLPRHRPGSALSDTHRPVASGFRIQFESAIFPKLYQYCDQHSERAPYRAVWISACRSFEFLVQYRAVVLMNVWKHCAFWLLLCAPLAASSGGGQIVDRMVANVNGHVLLQSDWEEELAFEAFLDARSPDSFTPEERKAALDRLIDQELLREEVRPSEGTPADQIAARISEVRKLHPEAATDDGWRGALQRYGLTQTDLDKRLGQSIQLMRLVEARLRPSIQIDQKAVESYYQEQLLPELKKASSREVGLPQVFGRIRDLLAEQKLNQLLHGWLASLRSASRIQTPAPSGGDQTR